MQTKRLGEFEMVLLLAILRLPDRAYGASILREIEAQTQRTVALGAVYKTLARLEAKGLVRSFVGEPTPERGGRRKRFYQLNESAKLRIEATLSDLRGLTQGLDAELPGGAL